MSDKLNNMRIHVVLICIGICFGLGFFVGKKSAAPMRLIQTVAGPVTFVTNTVTITQKIPVPESHPAAAAGQQWNDQDWENLAALPATPARDAELAALLEKLAAIDPARAMMIAEQEGNLKFRDQLIQAVLHGWARKSPLDAADWAMALQDSGARDRALSSVFAGAIAADPNAAVAMGQTLMQQYPGDAVSCGSRLIDALCDSGNFSAAAGLAMNGSSDQRNFWLGEAFSKWAAYQPQAAAQAAQAISDPQTRAQALHGITGGWAEADPQGAAQFLEQLPAGADRAEMLGQTLKSWALTDPKAAANWMINNSSLGPDLDQGLAQIATTESLAPDTAVPWAESINDPQLRSATLASVMRDWLYSDLPTAENYFQTTTNLSDADRQQLSEVITSLSQPPPTQ